MSTEEIERFFDREKTNKDACIKTNFKNRNPIWGLFVRSTDYDYLRSKNFWRIVTKTNFDQWNKTKDMNLSRIFSGFEFTKLVWNKDAFQEQND